MEEKQKENKSFPSLQMGDKVQSSLGEVLILDVQGDYLILFRINGPEFIKANGYEFSNNKLTWNSGEYYSSLEDLINGIRN